MSLSRESVVAAASMGVKEPVRPEAGQYPDLRDRRGRRRATADGLGDAVVSLGAVSRGYLDMTSLPRRLEARSRLVERFHVRELLHVRFPPQKESFCSHLLLRETYD